MNDISLSRRRRASGALAGEMTLLINQPSPLRDRDPI